MPPKKDKKKKPKKEKVSKQKQRQKQMQVVNINLSHPPKKARRTGVRVPSAPVPINVIRMNEPTLPLAMQPLPMMVREPLKETMMPSRLETRTFGSQTMPEFRMPIGTPGSAGSAFSGGLPVATAYASSAESGTESDSPLRARRARRPDEEIALDKAISAYKAVNKNTMSKREIDAGVKQIKDAWALQYGSGKGR